MIALTVYSIFFYHLMTSTVVVKSIAENIQ